MKFEPPMVGGDGADAGGDGGDSVGAAVGEVAVGGAVTGGAGDCGEGATNKITTEGKTIT